MFEEASSFNQDISKWNVSKVRYARWMFRDAISFNKNNIPSLFNKDKDLKFIFPEPEKIINTVPSRELYGREEPEGCNIS